AHIVARVVVVPRTDNVGALCNKLRYLYCCCVFPIILALRKVYAHGWLMIMVVVGDALDGQARNNIIYHLHEIDLMLDQLEVARAMKVGQREPTTELDFYILLSTDTLATYVHEFNLDAVIVILHHMLSDLLNMYKTESDIRRQSALIS
ncbi:hypothetical protein ACJX0J_022282, partial [Zea mays]